MAKSTDQGTSIHCHHFRTRQAHTRTRVNDWIHGIRAAAPEKETRQSLEKEPLHEGERLRIIHRLITNPESEGGAGIIAKQGEWENVESIFALHDHAYNKSWIKRMSTKYLLEPADLDEIRDRLGENVSAPSGPCSYAVTMLIWTLVRLPFILHSPSPTLPSSSFLLPLAQQPGFCSVDTPLSMHLRQLCGQLYSSSGGSIKNTTWPSNGASRASRRYRRSEKSLCTSKR